MSRISGRSPLDESPFPDAKRRRLERNVFVGVIVCVIALFTVGIWWLRQLPLGPSARTSGSVVQVVIPSPSPSAESDSPSRPEPSEAPSARTAPDVPVPDAPQITTTRESSQAEPVAPAEATPSAAPAEQSRSAASAQADVSSADFQKALFSHIQHYQQYPDAARADHLQGVTELLFIMKRDGTVLEIRVEKSSGHKVLDQAAIDTIRRAQPLPFIPSALPDRLNILFPIAFELR